MQSEQTVLAIWTTDFNRHDQDKGTLPASLWAMLCGRNSVLETLHSYISVWTIGGSTYQSLWASRPRRIVGYLCLPCQVGIQLLHNLTGYLSSLFKCQAADLSWRLSCSGEIWSQRWGFSTAVALPVRLWLTAPSGGVAGKVGRLGDIQSWTIQTTKLPRICLLFHLSVGLKTRCSSCSSSSSHGFDRILTLVTREQCPVAGSATHESTCQSVNLRSCTRVTLFKRAHINTCYQAIPSSTLFFLVLVHHRSHPDSCGCKVSIILWLEVLNLHPRVSLDKSYLRRR